MVFLAVGPDFYITPLLRHYYAFITPTKTFQENLAGIISLQVGGLDEVYVYICVRVQGSGPPPHAMVLPPATTVSEEICNFPLMRWLDVSVSAW